MKLFCSLPSPFARKARALAAEKGLELELVEVDVLDPASPVAALNPLRKVPCLVTDDGEAWFDSPVICEWLDAQPGPRLLPEDFAARMRVKRLEALADGLLDAAVLVRLESVWPGRTAEQRSTAWMDWQWLKIDGAVGELERHLAARAASDAPPAFFEGDDVTLADLAVASALEWIDFRLPDRPWRAQAPLLATWLARFSMRPAFAASAPVPPKP
ncbi:glutathione S-transferase family protein [Silanimonas sp.]|jgi:glutathione S-transferase|uniref:glutathione S-transferase family protein n=1 Tax=Silanimonas sp. TaxID=1929290 RepID=UPI0037C5A01F